ncbi:MAG: helix-turn-helix domain-containing protein [Oscillibacter sp.]
MRTWTKRDPVKNYFPLPNEIYQLGLSHGAIAVYGYLLRIEDRRTYQCHPSYATIGKAVGMSNNTVRKYVQELEERGLIRTERTSIITRDGRKQNGSLLYTILPIQFSIDGILSAADGCCGQSKGTAASGKTHGADQRVKIAMPFSALLLSQLKETMKPIGAKRGIATGLQRACGPAAPMNCVNPPLAGSRSSSPCKTLRG